VKNQFKSRRIAARVGRTIVRAGYLAVRHLDDCSMAELASGMVVHPPWSFRLAAGAPLDLKSSFNSSSEPKSYPESKIHPLEGKLNHRKRI